VKDIETVSLLDLLPDSISPDEKVRGAAQAIDPQLRLAATMVDIPSVYVSIDKLTSTQLDHMAVAWDITVWRDYWPVSLKRSVLKAGISEKRKKGTVKAVKDALSSISSAASIVEWWETEPKGTPHTFTIYATQADIEGTIDAEMQEDIIALIDDAKPLRSHYNFVIQNKIKSGINAYCCLRPVTVSKIYDSGVLAQTVSGSIGVVTAARPIIKRHLVARA
jgi:phage tail P2-like protein